MESEQLFTSRPGHTATLQRICSQLRGDYQLPGWARFGSIVMDSIAASVSRETGAGDGPYSRPDQPEGPRTVEGISPTHVGRLGCST
jgi:hypothetical protein